MEFLHTNNGVLYCGKNPIILRGMGLGGWLLPEGYMWKFYTKCDRPRRMEKLLRELCGERYAEAFWERYYDRYITERDIAWIAGQGLNSVRLAMNARHLFDIGEQDTVRFHTAYLRHVDDCLAWCKKYGIYLFLDMHGAPGGQTGQNIDDSESDIPELFTDRRNQDILVEMWRLLAIRYGNEPAIGGYDLLNEPIPNWNRRYNPQLLPLYRRLTRAIRDVDARHMIILEGAHWATDFSVFDDYTPEEAADNIVLEFHKYWSDPDEESLAPFVETAKRLNVPLWMGEGGENNLQWYTYAFPMYERLGIGWCFWAYKKMEVPNSPATFEKPEGWDQITAYLDGGERPAPEAAQAIFDRFLNYDRFFMDFAAMAIPFLPPETYGRSTLENSSFLVSSVNSDSASHGRGFVSRLSGSTAEFISIWNWMLFGKAPFGLDDDGLYLSLCPAIPARLLPEDGKLMGTFLGKVPVVYHAANLEELRPGAYRITGYQICDGTGTAFIAGSKVPAEWAKQIRNGGVLRLDVSVEPI